ncbi:MAG: hypothetical protein FWE29_05695 [Defluviitaleaceae bacterium]|nr:hypothetical protein [Defluviitaleaceae bacterium]
MQVNNPTGFSFISRQPLNKLQLQNSPTQKFSVGDQPAASEGVGERVLFIGVITVFKNDSVMILIPNRNHTNATCAELEEWGALNKVSILCKITKSVTIIHDVELTDKFFGKFQNFLDQHDLLISDFINYAKKIPNTLESISRIF